MQQVQVTLRIGEAIGVVDAQAVHVAVGHPAQHLTVGGVEHRGVLDAHRGEIADREEPPVAHV